jgi:argininosuccinate lyase
MKNTPLWSGRFEEALDPSIFRFNQSIEVDRALWRADCLGTLAHARELRKIGVLTPAALESIEPTLKGWATDGGAEAFAGNDWRSFEDVHSLLEAKLTEKHGEIGKRVHTGRSRNDQVATAFRLTVRERLDTLAIDLRSLRAALVNLADRHRDWIVPGYTHLQRAQPILFAHWCLAYVEMIKRDEVRLSQARARVNQLPLGSAALAGSPYPIDRKAIADELGFEGVCANSLDAVSDRDFCIDVAACCSLIAMHLSRLSEDLILYSSREFGFISLSDSVATGSSLMPQKKNPDVPELVRGKSGPIFGHLMALLTMTKGLPLAYNKDLQEDKDATFSTLNHTSTSLQALAFFLGKITLNKDSMRTAAATGHLNATDLADYLVGLGTPFRTAHEQAATLVRLALNESKELQDLTLDQVRSVAPSAGPEVFQALTLEAAVNAKKTFGSTQPALVLAALTKELHDLG